MRMLIVRLIFLLFSHGVPSLAQYPIESDANSIKSDNRSLLSIPITFIKTTESSKVPVDNRVNIQNQEPRDLNVINKTLSETDSFVSLNNTSDNFNVSDHNVTYTQNKNNTIVTSVNYRNAVVGSLEKYSINTPTTHGTIISMKTNEENITDYSNKLVNVPDVKTHSDQLANDTKGSDKLKEDNRNSNISFHTTWKKRHVDQSATRILGQSSYEKNPTVHSENIKNVFYVKSINITHDNGEIENLICTKLEIIPEDYRTSIIRKIDRFIKKTLANIKIHHSRNSDDNNEEGQDQNDNNDDDDDDDEDDYDDDDDDDCGCGCGCRRRRCCRCRKYKRRKCPSCEKNVTPPPESGRRSGATFPINFESSEVVAETTTPIETESPTTTVSSIPTLTSSTTSMQSITTSPTAAPLTTTIPSTTQYSTTSTTTLPPTTQYPTTSTTIPSTTNYPTTSTTIIPSTTQYPTTLSTSTITTTTTTTTIPTTTTTTPTTTTTTTTTAAAELSTTKKRNIKRKKCTKKKRRKGESRILDNANGNSTMDNDKEFNSSQPNRVPFSGLFENQLE